MQPLNDDMDDLFRKAAEDYPLQTDSENCNKVLQQLSPKEQVTNVVEKKKDYRFLWLLLLLPATFICGRYIGNHEKLEEIDRTERQVVKTDSLNGFPQYDAELNKSNASSRITRQDRKHVRGSDTGVRRSESIDKRNDAEKSWSRKMLPTRNSMPPAIKHKTVSSYQHSLPADRQEASIDKNQSGATSKKFLADVIYKDSIPVDIVLDKQVEIISHHDSTQKQGNVLSEITKPEQNLHKNRVIRNRAKLNYSFVFGPDVSTVKFNRTSNLGYSAGLMLRYQLTNRVSVESGVLWARKNYYSDGQYFDTTKVKLPSHSVLRSADGYCNMFEIPINLRYNVIARKNNELFISAGLSSYLMNDEEYELSYERYSQPYSKVYEYDNSSKDWFSIVNVSMGYQKNLGKAAISIAPYIKVPLRGVGIGKLPITSAGMYISFTRFIK